MKKGLKIIIVILLIIIVLIIGYFVGYKRGYNKIGYENQNIKKDISKILIEIRTYDYPYKMVIKVNKDGNVYKSKIIDELTKEGAPKDKFSKVGSVSKDDIIEIENIINEMKKETIKQSNYSEDYGMAINIGESSLYGCEFFSQENVDKLNTIIQKYE